MTTTAEVAVYQPHGLAIAADQNTFTPDQRAVLAHMGVENAPEPDLQVFMHVIKRSGLDPFARQIHMIGRNSKNPRTEQWETKYTIQTGIDGYRLIGRRAADRAGVSISIGQPEWAHEDGTWRPVWSKAWGYPVAARVTIERDGKKFTAVALFDEYRQTKRNGDLTQMWEQRPAGQLAKCCEALAWRMAFPQDLSGIYTDDEMGQAEHHDAVTAAPAQQTTPTAAAFRQPAPAQPAASDNIEDADEVPDEPAAPKLDQRKQRKLFQVFKAKGVPEDKQLGLIEYGLQRQVGSRTAITEAEWEKVIDYLGTLPDGGHPYVLPDPRLPIWTTMLAEAQRLELDGNELAELVVERFAQPLEDLTVEQLGEMADVLRQTQLPEGGEQ